MIYIYFYYCSLFLLFLFCFFYICGFAKNRQVSVHFTTRLSLGIHCVVSFSFLFFVLSSSTLSPWLKYLSILFHSMIILLNIICLFYRPWFVNKYLYFSFSYAILSLILYIFLIRWNWMYLYVHIHSLDHFAFHAILSLLITFLIATNSHNITEQKNQSIFFMIRNIFFKIIPSFLNRPASYYIVRSLYILILCFIFNPILIIPPLCQGYHSFIPKKTVLYGSGSISNEIRSYAQEYYIKSSSMQDQRNFPCTGGGWICSAAYPPCEKGFPFYTKSTEQWKHPCWEHLVDAFVRERTSGRCYYCYRSVGKGKRAFFQIQVGCNDTCRYYPERQYYHCNEKTCVSEYSHIEYAERFRENGGFTPEPKIQFDFSKLKQELDSFPGMREKRE